MIFLKISPKKCIFRFGKKGKLSSRYKGPFEVLERIGYAAYRLALLPQVSVHNMFHVSMLQKYLPNPSHQISYSDFQVDERLSYHELLVRTIDKQVRQLRNKQIPIVKVEWQHHRIPDQTWETRSQMQQEYPYLFT